MKDEVLNFIDEFSCGGKYQEIITIFQRKRSYWFALILWWRFLSSGALVMYDIESNRFGVEINEDVYDITGEVKGEHLWVNWVSMKESELKERVKNEQAII